MDNQPGRSLTKQESDALVKRLRADPEFRQGIRAGIRALREGRIQPWHEVAHELGIEHG